MKSTSHWRIICLLLLAFLLPRPLSAGSDSRLDINSATLQQLIQLPGITPVWAQRILRFRPYRAKDELYSRGILTRAEYDRIADQIVAHRSHRK